MTDKEQGDCSRRVVLTEVLALFAAGLAVLFVSNLVAGLGGFLAENAGALSAAYFLFAPIILLRRRGIDPASFGIGASGAGRGIGWALLAGAIVFPPYVLGFELYSRWFLDESFRVPSHTFSYFASDLRGRPDLVTPHGGMSAWVEGESFHVLNASDRATLVKVDGCGCPAQRIAATMGEMLVFGPAGPCAGGSFTARIEPGSGFRCETWESEAVKVAPLGDAPPRWFTGAAGIEKDRGPAVFGRSFWWLPELLLLHVVVVAIPEEVFYRGYCQTRLAAVFRGRWRFLGTTIGWNLLVASALFALSHLVTIPAAFRLAVFFPGCLFGWLRERTGSVVAPVTLHALSNCLLEILIRFHG